MQCVYIVEEETNHLAVHLSLLALWASGEEHGGTSMALAWRISWRLSLPRNPANLATPRLLNTDTDTAVSGGLLPRTLPGTALAGFGTE